MTSASESSTKTKPPARTIPLRGIDDESLMNLSREGLLSLTREEMKTIQSHFEKLGRDPTDVEIETLAQTWSEHCVHKTFKAKYAYRDEHVTTSYENLLKETIVKATEKLNPSWCLSVF